jgi:hypothetical protein
LLLAWLTVLPDIGPLPVSSQTRDMVSSFVVVKLRSGQSRKRPQTAARA